uniref:Uncharacterized protein n=1 Tax=Cannabis sativa TaxID=3483 RepID=A0A803P2P8_CANSA
MPVAGVGDGMTNASQFPSGGLRTSSLARLLRPSTIAGTYANNHIPPAYRSDNGTAPPGVASTRVGNKPHLPTGHVGTSTQGETLNACATSTILGIRTYVTPKAPTRCNAPLQPIEAVGRLDVVVGGPYLEGNSRRALESGNLAGTEGTRQSLEESPPQQTQEKSVTLAPTHPMMTRAKPGIFKPKAFVGQAVWYDDSEEPITVEKALKSASWNRALDNEIITLIKNKTWTGAKTTQNEHCGQQMGLKSEDKLR